MSDRCSCKASRMRHPVKRQMPNSNRYLGAAPRIAHPFGLGLTRLPYHCDRFSFWGWTWGFGYFSKLHYYFLLPRCNESVAAIGPPKSLRLRSLLLPGLRSLPNTAVELEGYGGLKSLESLAMEHQTYSFGSVRFYGNCECLPREC